MSWKPLRDHRVPETNIAANLERLMNTLGAPTIETQRSVIETWAEAVGADIAHHATPLSLVDGVLNVEVDDARWLTQLKWMGGRVADRLNEATGTESVERLNVRLNASKSGSKATANRL